MSLFVAQELSCAVDGKPLVREASFALEPSTLTMLVGPNGAGKTTLLRLALGLVKPDSGRAILAGEDVGALSPAQRARKVSYLAQQRPLVWPQPVRDIVALGRFAYGAAPGRLSQEDETACKRALSVCDLNGFDERAADTLSGGELSRVHLARALAAQTPLLIADEPVAALDPRYQHEVLKIFANAASEGTALLTVVHDLTLAARYADRLIWMKEGRIVAEGTPRETITPDRLRDIFGIEAQVDLIGDETEGETISLRILGPA